MIFSKKQEIILYRIKLSTIKQVSQDSRLLPLKVFSKNHVSLKSANEQKSWDMRSKTFGILKNRRRRRYLT